MTSKGPSLLAAWLDTLLPMPQVVVAAAIPDAVEAVAVVLAVVATGAELTGSKTLLVVGDDRVNVPAWAGLGESGRRDRAQAPTNRSRRRENADELAHELPPLEADRFPADR